MDLDSPVRKDFAENDPRNRRDAKTEGEGERGEEDERCPGGVVSVGSGSFVEQSPQGQSQHTDGAADQRGQRQLTFADVPHENRAHDDADETDARNQYLRPNKFSSTFRLYVMYYSLAVYARVSGPVESSRTESNRKEADAMRGCSNPHNLTTSTSLPPPLPPKLKSSFHIPVPFFIFDHIVVRTKYVSVT